MLLTHNLYNQNSSEIHKCILTLTAKLENAGDFKCEVECDGKVMIKGTTTTGESRMFKGSRLFHMQTQYLCPPGAFTVSFYLPGPVEPNQFTGTFGSDGILEGIVMKQRARTGAASLIFES